MLTGKPKSAMIWQSCAKLFTHSFLLKEVVSMTSNIYLIINLITDKKYVGQSINVNLRWKKHIYNSKNNIMKSKFLYGAMNKYGINNFKIDIIENNIDMECINEREKYWIKYYNSLAPNGYNLTIGGEGTFGYKHTYITKCQLSDISKKYFADELNRKKLSEIQKNNWNKLTDFEKAKRIDLIPKDNYDLDKMNEGFKCWYDNLSLEEKQMEIEKRVKTKESKNYDYYNFSFGKMDKEEKDSMYDKISKNNPRSTPIYMLDKDNIILREFHSIGEAARYLNQEYNYSINSKQNIRSVLDKNIIAYGFKWVCK